MGFAHSGIEGGTDTLLLALMGCLFHDRNDPPAASPWSALSEADHLALLRRAVRHQVGPLAARVLLSTGALEGGDVAGEAARVVTDNLARNLFLRSETALWRARLRRGGVACRPVKGVAWSTILYGDPGARTCADIDLLVRPEDEAPAMKAAADAGFLPVPCGDAPADDDEKAVHLRSRRGAQVYDLDLHWRLERPLLVALDHDALWPRPGEDHGESELPPDWIGVLLCLHLWRHGATLKTLVDFTAFARRFEGCLPVVREHLTRAGVGEGLDLALALAERTFKVRLRCPGPPSRKRVLLPLLDRCVRRPEAERGRYFGWLVFPLQYDGMLRPLARLGAHVVRPGVRDGRLRLGSRLARLSRAAGRAVFRGGRLTARSEATD